MINLCMYLWTEIETWALLYLGTIRATTYTDRCNNRVPEAILLKANTYGWLFDSHITISFEYQLYKSITWLLEHLNDCHRFHWNSFYGIGIHWFPDRSFLVSHSLQHQLMHWNGFQSHRTDGNAFSKSTEFHSLPVLGEAVAAIETRHGVTAHVARGVKSHSTVSRKGALLRQAVGFVIARTDAYMRPRLRHSGHHHYTQDQEDTQKPQHVCLKQNINQSNYIHKECIWLYKKHIISGEWGRS